MDAAKFDALFPNTKVDEKFSAWMVKVDAALVKKCGLSSSDLPDFCYYDAFEDGSSPAQAAKAALSAAKEF